MSKGRITIEDLSAALAQYLESLGETGGDVEITKQVIIDALAYTPEDASKKGVANGYAGLDGSGKRPTAQFDITLERVIEAIGYIPEDSSKKGSANGYASLDSNGKIPKAQTGLENVNNTSDVNKPVSTAQQQAINTAIANFDVTAAIGYTPANKLLLEDLEANMESSTVATRAMIPHVSNELNSGSSMNAASSFAVKQLNDNKLEMSDLNRHENDVSKHLFFKQTDIPTPSTTAFSFDEGNYIYCASGTEAQAWGSSAGATGVFTCVIEVFQIYTYGFLRQKVSFYSTTALIGVYHRLSNGFSAWHPWTKE